MDDRLLFPSPEFLFFDCVTIALAFGSTYNDPFPPWNPNADINVDGWVDIFDIVIVATNFSRVWCTLGWDPRADLNGDGIVDIFDIVVIALNFSNSY